MAKKLPKIIYVRWEACDSEEDPYLQADLNQADHAEIGETRLVGRYELKDIKRVIGVADVKD